MRTKAITRILFGTALVLLVPLVAMQFSENVQWGLADFVIIGALLIIGGITYELFSKRATRRSRVIIGGVIALAVLLVWVELAVGIFGTPFAGN